MAAAAERVIHMRPRGKRRGQNRGPLCWRALCPFFLRAAELPGQWHEGGPHVAVRVYDFSASPLLPPGRAFPIVPVNGVVNAHREIPARTEREASRKRERETKETHRTKGRRIPRRENTRESRTKRFSRVRFDFRTLTIRQV